MCLQHRGIDFRRGSKVIGSDYEIQARDNLPQDQFAGDIKSHYDRHGLNLVPHMDVLKIASSAMQGSLWALLKHLVVEQAGHHAIVTSPTVTDCRDEN
jgi:hypothetical protein